MNGLMLGSRHQEPPHTDVSRNLAAVVVISWAKEKKNWTVAQWSKVLFSDGSKFCISFGNQGPRVRVEKLIAQVYIYIYAFSRRFYPKRLTIAFRLYIFISMCVPWESNPQPFALLTQCSTTEPHRNTFAWSPVLSFHSLWWFGVQCHLLVLVHCVFWKPMSLHPFTKTFWSTSCFLLLTSFLKMLISFSSRIWHLPTLPKTPNVC